MNQADLLKAKDLSKQLARLGYAPIKIASKKPQKKLRASPYRVSYEALKPAVKEIPITLPAPEPIIIQKEFEITPDVVKEIIKVMHSLPENDKFEVSKGIRNASSFIYGGNKYGTHELMHGGANSTTSGTSVFGEVVAGSGTSWTLANTPTSGTVRLYTNGQRLTVTVDYSLSGANITTVLSWSAGTMLADYNYT